MSAAVFQMTEFKGPVCDIQMYLLVGNGMKDTRGRVFSWNGGVEVVFAAGPRQHYGFPQRERCRAVEI